MKRIIFGKNKNIIFKKLKEYRIKNNMTQGELAAKMQLFNVNIDQQMISKIERNDRIVTDYELYCFCRILQVECKDLFDDSICIEL